MKITAFLPFSQIVEIVTTLWNILYCPRHLQDFHAILTFYFIVLRVAWESHEKRATYVWRTHLVYYGTLIYYNIVFLSHFLAMKRPFPAKNE